MSSAEYMVEQIRPETTDEQILAIASVDYYRQEIAAEAAKASPRDLAGMVNRLAEAQGTVRPLAVIREGLASGASAATIKATLIGLLVNGPDDGWSGRTNDVRRAEYDGLREFVSQTAGPQAWTDPIGKAVEAHKARTAVTA